jgi:dolichol-phosphate mannosyltransferase
MIPMQRTLLSVVVPCFNEEQVIGETHRRLSTALAALTDADYEIVYVDDGSRDSTASQLRSLQTGDSRVRAVLLSRNFGHQVAISAGIEHAAGDAVVLIDADLQDPPEVIGEMLARWREGWQVAYGVRSERDGETAFKRWSARWFYRILNRLAEVDIPEDTGDFRLMDRTVVEALLKMPERDRFVRGMVSWVGFLQVAVPYRRAARFAGESKYPLWKMIRFATDGILSFSRSPLRLATWIGLSASGMALLGIVYALAVRLFTDAWVPGWTFLVIAVAFLGGVQLLSLGIIGEYVGRIYGETKQRPLYMVRERLGFDSERTPTGSPVNRRFRRADSGFGSGRTGSLPEGPPFAAGKIPYQTDAGRDDLGRPNVPAITVYEEPHQCGVDPPPNAHQCEELCGSLPMGLVAGESEEIVEKVAQNRPE